MISHELHEACERTLVPSANPHSYKSVRCENLAFSEWRGPTLAECGQTWPVVAPSRLVDLANGRGYQLHKL